MTFLLNLDQLNKFNINDDYEFINYDQAYDKNNN